MFYYKTYNIIGFNIDIKGIITSIRLSMKVLKNRRVKM